MYRASLVGTLCFAMLLSGVTPKSTSLQKREEIYGTFHNDVATLPPPPPSSDKELFIYPEGDYSVAMVAPVIIKVMEYVLNPVSAIVDFVLKVKSMVSWVIYNGSFVLLGVALVVGLCAFTPYCDLTIQKPEFLGKESFSYLDDIHNYFNEAYSKYEELQNSFLS